MCLTGEGAKGGEGCLSIRKSKCLSQVLYLRMGRVAEAANAVIIARAHALSALAISFCGIWLACLL
jgi:hypothetical protein